MSNMECYTAKLVVSNDAILQSNNVIIELLNKTLNKQSDRTESYLIKDYLLTSGSTYEVPAVQNDKYEKARIFVSVGFKPLTTSGISIDLYYAGYRFGEIINIIPDGSISAGSEPFDISSLNGFNFVIKNKDTSHDVSVGIKIVMYNDN